MEPNLADRIQQLLDQMNWLGDPELEENTSDYDSSDGNDSDSGFVFVYIFSPPEATEELNSNAQEDNSQGEQADHAAEPAPNYLEIIEENEDIRNRLACPICDNLVLSPVTLCRTCGHAVCTNCKATLKSCPTCIGMLKPGSLFVEKILNLCLVKCKFTDFGCTLILSGRELLEHHKSCEFGHLECLKCDKKVPNELFLEHLRSVEKMEPHNVNEFRFHYNITEEDLASSARPSGGSGKKLSTWEPCWLHCHNTDFFCFLDHLAPEWWISVGAFEPLDVCNEFKCSIKVQNQELGMELEYVGNVHPIRTSRKDVFKSGQFLLLVKQSLKNFLIQGKISVLVRIDSNYEEPNDSKEESVEPTTSSRAEQVSRNRRNPRNRVDPNPEFITHMHLILPDDGSPLFIPIPRFGGGLDLP